MSMLVELDCTDVTIHYSSLKCILLEFLVMRNCWLIRMFFHKQYYLPFRITYPYKFIMFLIVFEYLVQLVFFAESEISKVIYYKIFIFYKTFIIVYIFFNDLLYYMWCHYLWRHDYLWCHLDQYFYRFKGSPGFNVRLMAKCSNQYNNF